MLLSRLVWLPWLICRILPSSAEALQASYKVVRKEKSVLPHPTAKNYMLEPTEAYSRVHTKNFEI